MQIVNLTPHDIVVIDKFGSLINRYEKSGKIARIELKTKEIGKLPDGTPLTRSEYGLVEGLPEFEPNKDIYYIVSRLVKDRVIRGDLLVPSQLVRDGEGNIIGCMSLEEN
jgi:hypothetical protein